MVKILKVKKYTLFAIGVTHMTLHYAVSMYIQLHTERRASQLNSDVF